MFKRCTSLFLAFLLLVSSGGLAFNVHYCGDRIAAISSVYNVEEVCEKQAPVAEQKPCCAKELKKEHKKCCSDKTVEIKDNADEVIIKIFSFQIDFPYLAQTWKPLVFAPASVIKNHQVADYTCDANAPPLFQLYKQYIFYA